ncbi:tyrosine-type recombinase/integrase [Ruegeria sp. YS9]|uniref:tyrosine-type recombinase/integrase n=1 Tax=Ruegeria sp. YS9 TaxID=2966453 RepID=UPI00214BE5E1|nr:tyrosine-type recombinase/integrase [Ruegeria sp. YS9]UUV05882.1 tyrosine-type recombinase/integrase [Ruegeria sp. YS9]
MSKSTRENLRIKHKYLVWLQVAKGHSEATIDKTAAAISVYEAFLGGRDFRAFHSERARAFKRYLAAQKNARSGAPLSPSTINSTLREVKAFFFWLADQPGYKSKISHSDTDYLTPDRKSEAARRSTLWKPHPSLAQVQHLLERMPTSSVLQRRDRALVAFLFLTGSRIGAGIGLRLGHVDLQNACVQFDGRSVKTKFGKSFTTAFFPIGGPADQILRDWIGELRTTHLFSDADPLFPKTRVGVDGSRKFAALGIAREPWSNPSSAARIFKQAFTDAGLSPFSPHRVRDTLAELTREYCRTPEDYKAWSQNLGHDNALTTFTSYGAVGPGRQIELMARFRKRGPLGDVDVEIIE